MASPSSPPRPPAGVPVERVRGERPSDPSWRADALAGSRHSRLLDELAAPGGDPDPARARRLCAALARAVLGDLAPALVLLPGAERRRAQAIAAYAATLFDFARQRGVEGERLAQINRWDFEREAALAGQPTPQPVFVALAAAHRRRPLPAAALDRLAAAARSRVLRDRPASWATAERAANEVGGGLAGALAGASGDAAARFAGALVRLRRLQGLGEELAGGRCPLPRAALPDAFDPSGGDRPTALTAAFAEEARQIRAGLLAAGRSLPELPPPWRRVALFLYHAGQRLLVELEERGVAALDHPPHLGLAARLTFLLRARAGGRLGGPAAPQQAGAPPGAARG